MSKFSRKIKKLKPASSILINEKVEIIKKRKRLSPCHWVRPFF